MDSRGQQETGGEMAVELIRLSSSYRTHKGDRPNVKSKLYAARMNYLFWRAMAELADCPDSELDTLEALAQEPARRLVEMMAVLDGAALH